MKKVKIGFLGYGTRALDALMAHPNFEVRYFFAPEARLCQDVYDAAKRYEDKLSLVIVKNNADLREKFAQCQDISCFLMNACPIILKEDTLEEMPVFNIHPGDLRNNRGHQPHLWTILLGEKESRIVLHTVTPEIDEGKIICSRKLSVSKEDDAETLLNRLEDEIPYLLNGLYDYLCNDAAPEGEIYGGTYRNIMTYQDYEIDYADVRKPDFLEDISRKIRARAMHHGAFFLWEGKRIYVDKFLGVSETKDTGKMEVKMQEGNNVYVKVDGKCFCFRLNRVTAADSGVRT